MSDRRRVVVAGGGITGLALARTLCRSYDVTVIERSARLGGEIDTEPFRGHPVDFGPDSFITRNDAAETLCRALGLGQDLVAPAASRAGVYARNALHALPAGLVMGFPTRGRELWKSGAVSKSAAVRLMFEPVNLHKVAPVDLRDTALRGSADPSVGEIARERFGREVLETLIDPLVGGINASDVEKLSFAASLPQLVAAVSGARSLKRSLGRVTTLASLNPRPVFLGLRGGLSRLIDQLVQDLENKAVTLLCNTAVERIDIGARGPLWKITSGTSHLEADALVCTTPAFETAALIEHLSPRLAQACAEIPYANVVTVTGAWPSATLANECRSVVGSSTPPLFDHAGILISRTGNRLATAMSFFSAKWPECARADETVIRTSLGHYGDDRAMSMDDEQLYDAVATELATVLGISSAPIESHIDRWPRAFPQYTVGHLARVATIERLAGQLPSFALAGAAYHGIGIPACIDSAGRAAEFLARTIGGLET